MLRWRVRSWGCIRVVTHSVFIEASSRIARSEVNGFLWFVNGLGRSLHPLAALEVPLLKHLLTSFVQGPVVALSVPSLLGHLHEALVEGQVVSDGVLPALLVLGIVREVVHDELVDTTQGEPLVWRLGNGHGYESHIRVGRLDILTAIVVRVHRCKQRLLGCC